MRRILYFSIRPVICVLLSGIFTVSGQTDSLRNDLDRSFKKFDVVRIDAQEALADFGSGRMLKIETAGRNLELVLEKRDLRPARFRAEDTSASGVQELPRGEVATYKGYVRGETDSQVRINLGDEDVEGYFVTRGTRYFIESAKKYSAAAGSADFVVYRAEDYLGEDEFDCHTDLMERIENGKEFIASRGVANLSGLGVIELATDADFQYVNALGGASQANAEILDILNMAEGVFEEQLNLSIQVVFQHTWSTADPFNGSSASVLANSFKDYWNVNYPLTQVPRDTAHLFSAKPNVLSQGYAFIGVICSNPSFAYGISGRIDWAPGKYLVTTHEIGHNVGGQHAEAAQSCGNTIMNSALTGTTPLFFCDFSRNQIGNFTTTNGSCLEPPVNSSARFDFDGDGRTDTAIYRPAMGEWWYLRSSDNRNRAFRFGTDSDKMVPADYTGDGKTDVAFWRESTGEVFILRSEDSSFYSFPFGTSGDIPAPGDFDGDGKADFAVFRPSAGIWYILTSSGGVQIRPFGVNGDIPVVGDYDGDGTADVAILRPGVYQWWIDRSSAGVLVLQFGVSDDKPAPADFTGDGKTDVAFWRPATGEWFVIRSENMSFYSAPFGANGDVPVPGDYDGDGKADLAVWRPFDKTWYLLGSQNGFSAVGFGSPGDVPVPASFLRN